MVLRVTVSDLEPGETVFPRKTVSARKWRGQVLKEEKLYLIVERGGAQHVLYTGNDAILFFNDGAEVASFCQKHRLILEEKKGGEMRVTDEDLKPGDVVYLREHSEGGWCLLVERDGLTHTVMRNDDRPRRFDSRWEAWSYCQHGGFDLQEWDKPVPEAESKHHHISSRGERRLLPAPEDNLSLLPLDPEWGEAFVEAIKKQAPVDLERLAFLTEERERLLEELSLEIIRREARGNKSCLCRTCRHMLESPVREVQKEIDKIWSWWTTSLGTTPADVVAGRWSP